jgi:catechol 2,3-dioxygenase-like lactoylglutathione lyase family enzyme
MKYTCTVISADDINVSRKYYEEVFGLKVINDYGANVGFSCGLALQQGFDWLLGISKEAVMKKPNNAELCFEEEDFDAFVKKFKERNDVDLVHDVKEFPWGQRVIRFYDPSGHVIEVGESMKKVVERFIASGLSIEKPAERMGVSVNDVNFIINM